MLGKTHLVIGISATLAIARPQTISGIVLAAGVGAVGALISDIDVGTSRSHKDADKVTIFAVIAILMVIGLDYFLKMEIINRILNDSGVITIVAGFLIFIGTCAWGKEQPHRSFMHSFLALFILSFAISLIWLEIVPYFAIGFLSHQMTDIFNRKKVRLLYPLKGGVCLGLFHAHGIANSIFFTVGCVSSLVEVVSLVFHIG